MPTALFETLTPCQRYLRLAVAWLAMFGGAYTQFQLPPLAVQLIPMLGITNPEFASLVTAPMIPAVLFGIVAGVLSDRIGITKVIGIGLVVASCGVSARLFASSYMEMMIYMALSGTGSAFMNANISKIISSWFPPEQIAKLMGLLLTAGTAGMTVGMGTTALFPGVRSAFIFGAGLYVLATLCWLIIIRENREQISLDDKPVEKLATILSIPAKSPTLWIVGICLALTMGGMMAFSSFLPAALIAAKGYTAVTAGTVASTVLFGNLVSAVASPIIAQRVGYYRPYLLVLGILAGTGVYFGWQAEESLVSPLMFATGFCIGGVMPIYMISPVLIPTIGPRYAGAAGGIMSTLMLIGAVFIPSAVITPLAGNDYQMIFGLAAACLILMGFIALLLPELGPKRSRA